MIEAWIWAGTAPGTKAEGLRDREQQAKADAGAWLLAHPGGRARLMPARLADGTRTWSAFWVCGEQLAARRLRDGRIIWARLPRRRAAGGDQAARAA